MLDQPFVTIDTSSPVRVREPEAYVASVEPGSIAEQLGLSPGDRVARVNGQPPRDVIDWSLWTACERLELTVELPGGETVVHGFEKDDWEDLGLGFRDELFVPLRTCNNGCLFCFVDQAPPGMRPTVYVKDDDYRLSFLHGHFTTLTNLTEPHFERILAQRLSPLHVSVHASDPELRRALLDNQKADAGWDYLVRLTRAGIECHTQVVCCPGVNDGAQLERTIADLAALGDGVVSIGVVPVGLTRFQAHPLMRPMTPAEAAATIAVCDQWREWLANGERSLVYAADELYLEAGLPLPEADYYDGFPQVENGVGQTRLFLDEVAEVIESLPATAPEPVRLTLVTGEYGELLLPGLVAALAGVEGVDVRLVVVANRLFGGNVRCTGLLTGEDLAAALGRQEGRLVAIPDRAVNPDEVFLDDVSLDALAARCGGEVFACGSAWELVERAGLATQEDPGWLAE